MDQEALFETENPLMERLGSRFFDELPQTPGVYRMYSREHQLLYVGKAKNLRRRLFTYKNVSQKSGSRKTIRLVRMTHGIEYDECAGEEEALTEENRWIRTEKPPFNRAKKSPEAYYYISVVPREGAVEVNLRMHLREEEREHTFGAFKGHNAVRKAMGGFLRQLYILNNGIDCPFDLPARLLNRLTPYHFRLENLPDSMYEHLVHLLNGTSDRLLYRLVHHAHDNKLLERFIGKLFLKDMESMKFFYLRGPRRNYEIRRIFDLESPIIPQEKLDDYLVRLAFHGR